MFKEFCILPLHWIIINHHKLLVVTVGRDVQDKLSHFHWEIPPVPPFPVGEHLSGPVVSPFMYSPGHGERTHPAKSNFPETCLLVTAQLSAEGSVGGSCCNLPSACALSPASLEPVCCLLLLRFLLNKLCLKLLRSEPVWPDSRENVSPAWRQHVSTSFCLLAGDDSSQLTHTFFQRNVASFLKRGFPLKGVTPPLHGPPSPGMKGRHRAEECRPASGSNCLIFLGNDATWINKQIR